MADQSDGLERRDVLQSMAVGASALAGASSLPIAGASHPEYLENATVSFLDQDDLLTQSFPTLHRASDVNAAGQVDVEQGVFENLAIAHVNTTLPDEDDVIRPSCGENNDQVGVRHRFVAVGFSYGLARIQCFDPDQAEAGGAAIASQLSMTIDAETNSCGRIAFTPNYAWDTSVPLSQVSDPDAELPETFEELQSQVAAELQDQVDPEKPTPPSGFGPAIGLLTTALGFTSTPMLVLVGGILTLYGVAKNLTGLVEAFTAEGCYESYSAYGDDVLELHRCSGDLDEFNAHFADFTVTVPEGESGSFTLTQDTEWGYLTVPETEGGDPNQYVPSRKELTVTIPANQSETDPADIDLPSLPADQRYNPPTASSNVSYDGGNEALTLDASASYCGDCGNDIDHYRWRVVNMSNDTVQPLYYFGETVETTIPNEVPDSIEHESAYGEGYYRVYLSVVDGQGQADVVTDSFEVGDPADGPSAEIAFDSVNVGEEAFFSARNSSDPLGEGLSYHWDLDREIPRQDNTDVKETDGDTMTHTFEFDETYVLYLTVEDDWGRTDTEVATLDLTGPNALLSVPDNGAVGIPQEFSAERSSDPNGQDLTYTWELVRRTPQEPDILWEETEAPTIEYTFDVEGAYRMYLTVENEDGDTAETSRDLSVEERTEALLSVPNARYTGQPLEFDGSGSVDAVGDGLSYHWDLDREIPRADNTDILEETTSDPTLSHTFDIEATYRLYLTVEDGDGTTATDVAEFQVEPEPDSATEYDELTDTVQAELAVSESTPSVGERVTLDATGSYATGPDRYILGYDWQVPGTTEFVDIGPAGVTSLRGALSEGVVELPVGTTGFETPGERTVGVIAYAWNDEEEIVEANTSEMTFEVTAD
ncbi:PKD domain-containing protein [Haloarchaeobius baliensis]|uniref:PKD domain-containing protein n=1 Tax=Haloarchaeobius baliensis TaxID=1670458 RepID=UPI003F8821CF